MPTVTEHAKNVELVNWAQLQEQLESYRDQPVASWAFRGAGDACWNLRSSLERLDTPLADYAEQYLLTTFQRRVHHYISNPPAQDDTLEWLALLQHYGAPTRLLDWSKSPYVALFFALEQRRAADKCAVWAIDLRWCKQLAVQQLRSAQLLPKLTNPDDSLGKPTTFRASFFPEAPKRIQFVAPLQPFRMNERLTIQQGLFLCPGDVRTSFEDNLLVFSEHQFAEHVHKLNIERVVLREWILAELNKMNINRASLFPGIEGFAQSLITNLQIATSQRTITAEIERLNDYSEYGFA